MIRRRPLVLIVLLGGFLLALIVALQWAFFAQQKQHVKESRAWVKHTDDVIDTLENMFGKLRDSELGQRGYLITGYEEMLNPHRAALGRTLIRNDNAAMGNYDKRTLLELRAELRGMIQDNPTQLTRFDQLERLIEEKLAQSERLIHMRRDQGAEAAFALVRAEHERHLMKRIRHMLSDMVVAEDKLMQKRMAHDDAIDRQLTSFILISALLAYGGLALALLLIVTGTMRARRTAAQLRIKEMHFRAVAENGLDAFFLFRVRYDAEGMAEDFLLDYSNPVASCGMDADRDQMRGRPLHEVLPHDAADHITAHYLALFRNNTPEQHEYCVPVGAWKGRCFQRQIIPLEDGIALLCRDITAQKEMARMKTEFVSTVSHELRTPLTSIRGSLGLIIAGVAGPVAEQAQGLLTIAHSNCERLVRLINDILDIEKIEAGNMTFHSRPLSLAPFLKQALETNEAFAAKYHVRLELDAPGAGGAQICADADRLMQIVTNLLSNAAKFSPEGGSVTLRYRRDGGRARIEVEDRGAGIAPQFQPGIFGRFVQGDASDTRQCGGTGLGLSIVKEMVHRMDGDVDFESALGEGSRFWITFPLIVHAERAAPVAGDARPRILVCEDDGDVAQFLSMVLERAGFACDVAGDAAAAMRCLQSQDYAAMTLDLLLPDAYGLELLRSLRADSKFVRLPILIISARAEHESQGSDADVIDWIGKPIDTGRLLGHLRMLTGDRIRPRVLHVEDDDGIAEILRLAMPEADLVRAASLAEARLHLQEPLDLVVLDIGLPDGAGTELLPSLNARAHAVPVVLFTASDVASTLRDAVDASLVKSRTSESMLVDTIRQLIGHASPHPEIVV